MERKGTKIRRLQEQIFHEAWTAQDYYEQFRHHWNDRDFTEKQMSIYEELSYLISYMGWAADYLAYCEAHPKPNAA